MINGRMDGYRDGISAASRGGNCRWLYGTAGQLLLANRPRLDPAICVNLMNSVFLCMDYYLALDFISFFMSPLRRHIFVCFMAKSAFFFLGGGGFRP